MTDFIIITAGDIHIGDINPRSRIDDFKETILGKIEQLRVACNKLKADALIIPGDLFNLKNPNKNTHGLVRELIEIFKKFKCPIYMIPGNHDLTGNSLESLRDQPLGVLFASGSVTNLTHEMLQKKGTSAKISLVGIPYTENLDLKSISLKKEEDCIAQICVMHIYASPQAGMVFKEKLYGYDELATLGADIYVLGHYHIDQGIQEVGGKYFVNLGSISRESLAEENIKHQPKMGIIRISQEGTKTSIIAESLPLQIKPAEEVFDLKKRESEKREIAEIQKFVDQLIIGTSSKESTTNIEALIDIMGVAKAVKDKTLYFIHEAATK
jgi:DNA repair exonuclease SbcCD nuclease subunit